MSAIRAWCELIRLPNTPTALADVLAGVCLATGALAFSPALALLMLASASLYACGIILNDICDIEVDRRERPGRPLPSGRVTIRAARRAGFVLAVGGLAFAAMAARLGESGQAPVLVAGLILVCILGYDCALKSTRAGPILLGACRGLNLALGMCVAGPVPMDSRALPMIAMFVYVLSFSSFGRDEAASQRHGPGLSRRRLVVGAIGAAAGLVLAGGTLATALLGDIAPLGFWLAAVLFTMRRAADAIRRPGPDTIQSAMTAFILGVVLLDAAWAAAAAGWIAGAVVAAMLLPALFLGRWLYAT